jgi:DNA topoisomerase-3
VPVLYLCEKPSQAEDLARVLSPQATKTETHWNTPQGQVTWAVGHLLTLASPDQMNPAWKRWDTETLPMLPQQWRWLPIEKSARRLEEIGALLKNATEVVLSTDAEREGELIGRLILDHHQYKGPLKRLWIKALDPESIRHALANPLDGHTKDGLYLSAKTRAYADWIVGMSASRAATLRFGVAGEALPVGRVQTPTLAMLAARDLERAEFVSQAYHQVTANVTNGTEMALKWVPPEQFPTAEQAEAARKAVEGAGVTVKIERSEYEAEPSALFCLSTLQARACEAWGFTAAQTLQIAQRLYEHHKILSYPRSDSTTLPTEQKAQIPRMLSLLGKLTPFQDKIPTAPVIRDRVFVEDLDSAHHAIIPTILEPQLDRLSPEERRVYLLVAASYLANVHPNATMLKSKASMEMEGHKFELEGEEAITPGWKILSKVPAVTIPRTLEASEPMAVSSVVVEAKQTEAPAAYTDGTLIMDMRSVGKFVTNEKVRAFLKPNSAIGTEATRCRVIEHLLDDDYLTREGTSLKTTPRAQSLIATLRKSVPLLCDPGETALWEDGLKRIETGDLTYDKFMDGIEKRIRSHCVRILGAERPPVDPSTITQGEATNVMCPLTKLPVRDLGKAWLFPGFPSVYCPKTMSGATLGPDVYAASFTNVSPLITSFKSNRTGKGFEARLAHNPKMGKIEFLFPEREAAGRTASASGR